MYVGGRTSGFFPFLFAKGQPRKNKFGFISFFFLRLRPKNEALALEGAQEKTHAPGLLLAHSPRSSAKEIVH